MQYASHGRTNSDSLGKFPRVAGLLEADRGGRPGLWDGGGESVLNGAEFSVGEAREVQRLGCADGHTTV